MTPKMKEPAILLKAAGMDLETAVRISFRVEKPEKLEKMIAWMKANKTATTDEICKMSRML